jgi:hypothetical protein
MGKRLIQAAAAAAAAAAATAKWVISHLTRSVYIPGSS